jgi:AcrR family transcriptional regulator
MECKMARRADHTREELRKMSLVAAQEIVAKEGLSKLSTRKVAEQIGYTVGTLYQLFLDADDLIERMNAKTLSTLREYCKDVDLTSEPAISLTKLSKRYIQFTKEHKHLWAAIIEFQLPDGRDHSELYLQALFGLLGMIETAIKPYFGKEDADKRLHHARLLWASFYGIHALAASRSLPKTETIETLAATLIEIHLTALSSEQF